MSNETKGLIGISIATLVLVVGAAFLFGGKSSPTAEVKAIKNTDALIRKDSHIIKATEKNSVTIVEFGDFQCPACGVVNPVVNKLLQNYKGKITLIFREFPLPMHSNSQPAAQAAEAAGAQGKFFEMHDLIYANQKEWSESKDPLPFFVSYAQQLHLDVAQFKNDVTSKKYAQKIQKDIDDGFALNVNETPTFFINNVPQRGGLEYNDFKDKIDNALKNTSK
jgi:protein-disulfide isomerase